ncbi:MAG: TlpA family protein disulfide reductase [Tannerellaceae bacterium]|nr:TlpA family protein disulfide reductase [Tannerellaceae bacterium]
MNALIVNYCDPVQDDRYGTDLSASNGLFKAIHYYTFPRNLTIRYNNQFINVYINPGDSVFVTIDGEMLNIDPQQAVTFSGSNADVKQQIYQWTTHIYKQPIPYPEEDSAEERLAFLKQQVAIIQDTLNAFSQRVPMSEEAGQWAIMDYKYILANYYLSDFTDDKQYWKILTDPFLDVFNEFSVGTMYFDSHINACMGSLIAGIPDFSELMVQKKYSTLIQQVYTALHEKAPEGKVRDLMLYYWINQLITYYPESIEEITNLPGLFAETVFQEQLNSRIQDLSAGNFLPFPDSHTLNGLFFLDKDQTIELPTLRLLPYLVERYKNKVLYIDCWATWCRPCIQEMQYAPALHDRFKQEDVVFINLCMESTQSGWKSRVEELNIQGENYFLEGDASKLFRADNNISGYPNYMLISKNGRILNGAIARPSDPEQLIPQIESCLTEE